MIWPMFWTILAAGMAWFFAVWAIVSITQRIYQRYRVRWWNR